MLTLEHIKLLETKIAQTVDYIDRLTGENASLRKKLYANQKRIDELEGVVSRFKEEQGRFEDVILSALDRLSQFENAIEKSLASRNRESKPTARSAKTPGHEPAKSAPQPDVQSPAIPDSGAESTDFSAEKSVEESAEVSVPESSIEITAVRVESVIPDIQDPLEFDGNSGDQPDPDINGELDIF
jgi:chromosome segregation ATPase